VASRLHLAETVLPRTVRSREARRRAGRGHAAWVLVALPQLSNDNVVQMRDSAYPDETRRANQ
jgi:hypothetical protein